MPFPIQDPKPYTRTGIEWLNVGQFGVYGIYRHNICVYVGRGDMRTRLLAHFNGDNPLITRENPTHYVGWVTTDDARIEKQLIIELDPIANQKIG